jgi:isocitrate/isopropylmalate dehydrogenase
LIDATFALLVSSSGAPMVIPALNRDGDILSDLVLPLFGSIAGSESLLVAFGEVGIETPTAVMAEAAHGTAPALEGKDVANPMAMILAAAGRYPDVAYEPQLIDATFALLVASTGDPLVIPALNRDGDILSDLVLPLFGSIAGSESLLVAFAGDDLVPTALMAEAAHGTAPALQGKNVANPLAMILAAAALLSQTESGQLAGRAIRESALEAVAEGVKTADLGGHSATTEFTDEVIRRTRTKLEVWAAL